jgi:hypothetical protein
MAHGACGSGSAAAEEEAPDRGAGKKKSTDPPCAFAKSQTHLPTHQPTFSPLPFFLVRFWASLGKGSKKTPPKLFLQKVHVEIFCQKNRQKFQC